MNAITGLRHELSEGWKSLAEGWSQIRERASNAITRYRRGSVSSTDTALEDAALSSPSWGLLAGEVFEDRDRVVVRLEAPGMDVKDFDLQIVGDLLCVRGEKRSSHESGDGHYRLLECAYGSFERSIRLPAEVRADKAKASYRRGVLAIELPKASSRAPRHVKVKVN